jgi:hypothetical protein
MITNLARLIAENPLLIILTFLITVGTPIWGIYSYYDKGQKPKYFIKSTTIISKPSEVSQIEIYYQQQIVNAVTISKILFFNAGKSSIRRNDIAKKKPIRISLKQGINILNAEVIYRKKQDNDFNIRCENNDIIIDFDFLEKGDGGIIQIVHTGQNETDINLVGKVIGVNITYAPLIEESKTIKEVVLKKFLNNTLPYLLGIFFFYITTDTINNPLFMILITLVMVSLLFVNLFRDIINLIKARLTEDYAKKINESILI